MTSSKLENIATQQIMWGTSGLIGGLEICGNKHKEQMKMLNQIDFKQ
jgi:hypothetical protein